MRHHRGADDADGDEHHSFLAQPRRKQGPTDFQKLRLGLRQDEEFDEVASADSHHQQQNERFDGSHSEPLQGQQQQYIQPCDEHGPEERDVEHEVQRDSAAEHFGQVAGGNGNFAK